MTEHILVVDDDHQLTAFLSRYLTKQGYAVQCVGSAMQMGLAMEHRAFELIILDVGLPDIDGFEVTRELRRSSRLPIIMLTARDEIYDKILGLELGVDDYIPKPFEPRELLARIRSVLRRTRPTEVPQADALPRATRFQFDGITMDIVGHTLTDPNGQIIALTGTEFSILKILAQHAPAPVSRKQIMDLVYGTSIHVTERAIDAHVARLRKKLPNSLGREALIRTIHGSGYLLATKIDAT